MTAIYRTRRKTRVAGSATGSRCAAAQQSAPAQSNIAPARQEIGAFALTASVRSAPSRDSRRRADAPRSLFRRNADWSRQATPKQDNALSALRHPISRISELMPWAFQSLPSDTAAW